MLLSKLDIVAQLAAIAHAHKGTANNIGGDCYALCVDGEIRVVVAVKELVKQDKTLWIGMPRPVIELLTGERHLPAMATPSPYRGLIAVSHVRYKTLLMIPVVPVAQDLVQRAEADRTSLRDEFDVKMLGYKRYVIQTPNFQEDIPVKHVDTFYPVEMLLTWPRRTFEERTT